MPKQNYNAVMRGTRGLFADQVVFRMRGGKQYVSKPPETKQNRPLTPAQEIIRNKFRQSAAYAKNVMGNEPLKLGYLAVAKTTESAYNVAFADAFKGPQVEAIDTTGYTGAIGSTILVQATDNFKVDKVMVTITTEMGVEVEHGLALVEGGLWKYTSTVLNEEPNGSVVSVTAYDLPGNTHTMEAEV